MLFGRLSMFLLDCIQRHHLVRLLGLQGTGSLGMKEPFLGKKEHFLFLPLGLPHQRQVAMSERCQGKGAVWGPFRPSGA